MSNFGGRPTQLLCIIPVPIMRWVCVGIAFGLSGHFLFANVYPVLAAVSADPSNKFQPTAFDVPFSPRAPGHSWTDISSLNNAINRQKPKSHVFLRSSYSFSTLPSQYVSRSFSLAPISCRLLVAMTLSVLILRRPMPPPLPQTYPSDPYCIDSSNRHHHCASLYSTVGSSSPPDSD
jgi:hypothetical protein